MKYDLHLHTCFSLNDGFDHPKEFFKVARKKGLSGLSICDHNSVEGTKVAKQLSHDFKDIVVIRGQEISSKAGHILAYGIDTLIPRDLSLDETIEAIHDEGGISIAAHAFDFFRKCVDKKIIGSKIDGIECTNGHTMVGNSKAKRIAKKYGYAYTAGSDSHLAKHTGLCYVECDAETEDDIITAILKKELTLHGKSSFFVVGNEFFQKRLQRALSTGKY